MYTAMEMATENSLEDYWEDASVSWGCRGLSFSSCLHAPPQQIHREVCMHNKPFSMKDLHTTSATHRPRSFPPPIAICSSLSIKTGGRFVLKEMALLPSHGLRAEREEGRLCLHLIEPQELDEDEDDAADDRFDNACDVEDTPVCAGIHQQAKQDGYKAPATEDINVSVVRQETAKHDTIRNMLQEFAGEGAEAVYEEAEGMSEKHARAGQDHAKECNRGSKDVEPSTSEEHAGQHIENRDNSIVGCMQSGMHANEIESKNGRGAYVGVLGIGQHQRASLRSKEGSKDSGASLSPLCSPKQGLPHQSFARANPALSLAVS